MLENDSVAENLAKNGGCLVDDRGERDRVDDPIEIVPLRVLQGEGERSERLAAAGRDSQREEPPILEARDRTWLRISPRKRVDRRRLRGRGLFRHIGVEPRDQIADDVRQLRPFPIDASPFRRAVEGLGVAEIGVHEARENHASEEGQAIGDRLPVAPIESPWA